MQNRVWWAAMFSAAILAGIPVMAQQVVDPGFKSVGRGAPMIADANKYEPVGASIPMIFGRTLADIRRGKIIASATNGETPPGVEPLEVDLYTSRDFYQDRELWTDQRYFRCSSPEAIEEQWGAYPGSRVIGDNPPASAPWGYCDRDYPREAIVSPYKFETAREHYEALLDETRQRGGPTKHTYATVPGEWTGHYAHPGFTPNNAYWFRMRINQATTILSLLTEEYQTRFVQLLYHEAHDHPQWPSQYCWPEGFMRRWHEFAVWDHYIMVTPSMVQILAGVARNFITNIHIGRKFNMDGSVPRLGADVPRWYGETIGFWDHDTLITWTSNIQGWFVHGAFEYSNKMQTIEIYSPRRDENGKFLGLSHEAIFYDPEALVEPIRIVRHYNKVSGFEKGDPYVFVECIPTIMPINGVPTPVSPGEVIQYEIPDMYGRPWAHNWEKYFEKDMHKPEEEDIFSFE